MTDASLRVLRQLLLTSYDDLKARLTQRLGSSEDVPHLNQIACR